MTRLGHFSRVGWCFNTARDFLEFHALTRAGIRPDHAVALLNTGHHVVCKLTDGPETHSSSPSAAHDLNDRDRDRKEFAGVRTSFQGDGIVF